MQQVEAAATVILDMDEEVLEEPQQQTVRRGGVSAEAIQEEDLGDYVKKVKIDIEIHYYTLIHQFSTPIFLGDS